MAKDVQTSRLRRALGLSKLGARLALKQGKRLVTRDQSAVHREMAVAMVRELGRLKGLPMKVGQILSYMDGAVPDEHRDLYQEVLGELRTTSEPVEERAWRQVFLEEIGDAPEEVFDAFDPEPLAAASIGQVHAAVLRGVEVCVKIQYPGIAEATRGDLENVEAIVRLMRGLMPNVDTRQLIDDFRVRLEEECDYGKEAAHQARFAEIYRRDETLMVPEVVEELSTRRVLTTRRVRGVPLERFVASSTRDERDRAGRALFRFAFGSLLQNGLFHADPHPGNLLFRADGTQRLCVLDYGCVQPVDAAARDDIAALLTAALEGDDLVGPARRALGIVDADPATEAAVVAITERVLAPILEPQPYRFDRTFAAEITRATVDAKMKLATAYLSRRGRFVAEREGVMFIVRNLFGLATIWGTLETEGDFREIVRGLLPGPPQPASRATPA
jgi:predicted unusual protein kinase regulating ubiquinone biosynthesis (AarF/ABC1/UbiB family)